MRLIGILWDWIFISRLKQTPSPLLHYTWSVREGGNDGSTTIQLNGVSYFLFHDAPISALFHDDLSFRKDCYNHWIFEISYKGLRIFCQIIQNTFVISWHHGDPLDCLISNSWSRNFTNSKKKKLSKELPHSYMWRLNNNGEHKQKHI